MYKVEMRIFGNYCEVERTDDYQEALKAARHYSEEGWLHVRIVFPNGTVIENNF